MKNVATVLFGVCVSLVAGCYVGADEAILEEADALRPDQPMYTASRSASSYKSGNSCDEATLSAPPDSNAAHRGPPSSLSVALNPQAQGQGAAGAIIQDAGPYLQDLVHECRALPDIDQACTGVCNQHGYNWLAPGVVVAPNSVQHQVSNIIATGKDCEGGGPQYSGDVTTTVECVCVCADPLPPVLPGLPGLPGGPNNNPPPDPGPLPPPGNGG